jgi:hypothetical protein
MNPPQTGNRAPHSSRSDAQIFENLMKSLGEIDGPTAKATVNHF